MVHNVTVSRIDYIFGVVASGYVLCLVELTGGGVIHACSVKLKNEK